jgi:4-hydroxyphenylpyruvate dioxygenase
MTSDRGITENSFLRFIGIDHVEFYVGNAVQAAHFYETSFGFTPIAYSGLETSTTDRVSFVLSQHNIRLVLTSGLTAASPIAGHVHLHGDGVRDLAFEVEDAEYAFDQAIKRGGRPVSEPSSLEDDQGQVKTATIATCGDTVHSFIQRKGYKGAFLPGFRPIESVRQSNPIGLTQIDHAAIAVEGGQLDRWVQYYSEVFGFNSSHEEDVETGYTGMNSKVVQDNSGRIRFPIVAPAIRKHKSQIDEFLHFYGGAGIQHIALSTPDIGDAVKSLKGRGVKFLATPSTYYDSLDGRVGRIEEDINELRDLNILADCDNWGYLMQIFTAPVEGRPTLFWEIIQRRGARGFGSGNIKALFQAVERAQALRGTL